MLWGYSVVMKLENKNPQFTKIQELVYELKVAEVMTRNLITVGPSTKMSELREILRDNRIQCPEAAASLANHCRSR